MSIYEDIIAAVGDGNLRATESAVRRALDDGASAEDILNSALLPAIQSIGDRCSAGSDCIPELLCSAKCMSLGLELLQPCLEHTGNRSRHKAILGTVEGDLHDIGKNLVAVMLRAAGFEVIDLGVDVTAREFVRVAREHPEVHLVCLSCLLTTSMSSMQEIVQALRQCRKKSDLKIMIGGAPVTQNFARQIGADYYTMDAFSAAQTARRFVDELDRQEDRK